MNILHLNNEKTWRGGERQTLLLARALPRFQVSGALGCRPNGLLAERAAVDQVPTIRIAGNSIGALLDLVRAARGFDLIHCHTARGHSLATAAAFVHRKPIIVTRRVDFLPGPSRFNRLKYSRAARVVCISEFIARQLEDWGVPGAKLSVIRSAVPPCQSKEQAPELAADLRARFGIAPDKKLVGNIAALVGHKDQATLLRAAARVLPRRKDIAFIIIGEGELRTSLLRLRQELGLTGAVHFAGFIPGAERFLPAFDVLAMSSCMEGLGSIVLDAFAAGVPVAATAGGGLPELVRNNQTGLLAPVGDAGALGESVLRLIEDGELRRRVCAAARAWVENECSVETMASRYARLYRCL